MSETASAPEKQKRGRAVARSGRPPRERAGEVEERILKAARQVFVNRGFEAATIEEIAAAAHSGKPTIYARFPNKQALFAAAVTRYVFAMQSRLENEARSGATIEQRLANIGARMLEDTLTTEWIGLLRLAIGEARRFPDLGRFIIQAIRERGQENVARLIAEAAELGADQALLAFRPERLVATTRFFLDLTILSPIMRALAGEPLESLRAEIGPHVSQRVAFFLDACRYGGVG